MDITMKWFRFYQEVLNDPKVQSLDCELFKFWVNILCVTSHCDGMLPSHDEIAFYLRVTRDYVDRHMKQLKDRGLIDTGKETKPHNWDKRQYKSDTSAERTKKYRERKKQQCDVTQNVTNKVTVTPPESDTDTDTDIKDDDDRACVDNYRKLLADRGFYLNHLTNGKTLEMFQAWIKDGVTTEEAQQAMDRADAQLGARPNAPSYYRNIPYQIRDEFKQAQNKAEVTKNDNFTGKRTFTKHKSKTEIFYDNVLPGFRDYVDER
jgi:DNA-binding MarR family transcriptional regulator